MAEHHRKLQLKVGLEGEPDPTLAVTAFVFDQAGTLVGSGPLKGGKVDLTLPAASEAQPLILLGPSTVAEDGAPTVERLRRVGAHEPLVNLGSDDRRLELAKVPELDWSRWLLCSSQVRGRVVRPVHVGGAFAELPVCNAIVHICEVDRWPQVIAKLPDHLLERLRAEILVGPIPEPDPPPFVFDPRVTDPSPVAVAALQAQHETVGLNPQPLPPEPPRTTVRKLRRQARPKPAVIERKAPVVNEAVRAVLSSDSLEAVRQILISEDHLFLPFICWWPWLWSWFTCDEVAVVTTDDLGRFAASVLYPCKGDRPDIYVWVEYPIGGAPTTVYRPNMACNTYWNYESGRELTVRVTDPRVPWCGTAPRPEGSKVVIVSIGEELGFPEIQRGPGSSKGLTTENRPLGGSIEPVVFFGTSLPADVTHYRWSVRQIERSDGGWIPPNPSWRGLDHPVGRHYEAGGTPLWLPLGPDVPHPDGPVFKIPPVNPPAGVWRPALNNRANSASAFFQSWLEQGGNALAGAGKYELKFELFRIVAGPPDHPVPVRLDDPASPIGLEVTDEALPVAPGTTPQPYAPPPEENLLRDASGNVVGFRWTIHVDNNRCQSGIAEVRVGGNTAGSCGFVAYPVPMTELAPTAKIGFVAFHPNGFGIFNFTVNKGSSGEVAEATVSSASVTAATVNGFQRNPAQTPPTFEKDVPVSALVGTCPGGQAAFAELLRVQAMATDGWTTPLTHLNAPERLSAFALEPGGG